MTSATAHTRAELFELAVGQTKDYALFLLDPSGCVMTWNAGAERIKGYKAGEIIGRHFSTFYTSDSVASGWPAYELQTAAAQGRFEDEGWRVRKDGSRFWANVVITALREVDGRLLGFSKITRDLTRRKMREEALRESEEKFRLLVDGVTDYSIYMLDPEGVVTSWNNGAQRITGYRPEEIIGKHFSRFYLAEDVATGRPWRELARARQTGRAEDEGWRVKKDGERFWARVAVNALHDSFGRLRGFAKITQDLTERRSLRDLEAATGRLNEFLAVLAHELRNPLAPIRSAVKVMASRADDAATSRAMRATIDRQSAHLERIVNDMLDIARMTRGKLQIEHRLVDLESVINATIEACRPLIDERGHDLQLDLPGGYSIVSGDGHRLTQLLTNLLNNAARYTPQRGHLRLLLTRDHGQALIAVQDDGRGIEPAQLDHIFEMFVQGREPLQRVGEGLGIGLALARAIADLHGGSLVADSAGLGLGSTFTLRLPLAAVQNADTETGDALTEPASNKLRHLLIVDDNVDAAESLGLLLGSLGHHVDVAHSGKRALELAAGNPPDVVLLDIGMPDLDGYEIARRMREANQGHPMQIIAVTGWGQPSDREKSRAAGFDLHLVKPVDQQQLTAILGDRAQSTVH